MTAKLKDCIEQGSK